MNDENKSNPPPVKPELLARALKKAADAGDMVGLPTWIIGSKEDPSFIYGIVLAPRELVSAIISLDDDLMITGMVKNKEERDADQSLH